VPGKAVGRAAVELPWLCPNTKSLIALAETPASLTGLMPSDPALALFLLRFAAPSPEPDPYGFAPGALHSAILPETAAALLAATRAGVIPSGCFTLEHVREVTETAATMAASVAASTRLAPAEAVATAVRLAPLGWYAIAAIDPFSAGDPLSDVNHVSQPADVQAERWGLDQAAIARRLAERWRLPAWVGSTIGSLTLPLHTAARLVSHLDLFAIVQLSLILAEDQCHYLGLTHGSSRQELLDHLHLNEATLGTLEFQRPLPPAQSALQELDPDPHRVPLVRNLLKMSAESRRRNGPALVARLEEKIDSLHTVAAELGEQTGERLRTAKLSALAELAAGAGHEINNPLAVISGNAQRLLRTEADEERSGSLRSIVRQTQRIATILRDLMQFARPPRPEPRTFSLQDVLSSLRDELAPLVAEKNVELRIEMPSPEPWVDGDQVQIRHAIASVVRNGIEATAPGGWVRIAATSTDEAWVTIAVEDSGPGLTAEAHEHAFDPFFCGRSAGRGRGLGLPTAWQLARQNGGDLRHDARDGGPTRFVMNLRAAAGRDLAARRSA
jgi:signal transduction histidine kinase